MKLRREEFIERLRNIKLIASDVDGSILNSNQKIGEITKEYCRKLKSKGILFTFATQRIFSSIVSYAQELNIDIPLITINGASIKDLKNNIVYQAFIKPRYVQKAMDLTQKYYVRMALCYGDEIIFTEDNSVLKDYMYRIGTDYRMVDSYDDYKDKVLEIIMLGNEKDVIKKIQKKLNFPYKMHVNAKYFRGSVHKGIFNLEIRRSKTNKRTGMKKLAKYLNISKKDIAVIGDWYNDRDMFEFGGLNIAMGNAVPELKNMADYITEKSNEEDGVGEILKMCFESKI